MIQFRRKSITLEKKKKKRKSKISRNRLRIEWKRHTHTAQKNQEEINRRDEEKIYNCTFEHRTLSKYSKQRFIFLLHHHPLVLLCAATLRSSSIADWVCIRSFTCASARKHTFNFGANLNILRAFSHSPRFTSSSSLTMCFFLSLCLLLGFCLCISQTATYQLKAQVE